MQTAPTLYISDHFLKNFEFDYFILQCPMSRTPLHNLIVCSHILQTPWTMNYVFYINWWISWINIGMDQNPFIITRSLKVCSCPELPDCSPLKSCKGHPVLEYNRRKPGVANLGFGIHCKTFKICIDPIHRGEHYITTKERPLLDL